MKFHFESDLSYQRTAIEWCVTCSVVRKYAARSSQSRATPRQRNKPSLRQSDLGVGNRLQLLDDELLNNLATFRSQWPALRRRWLLGFHRGDGTGTGKTYVYLRTIFELNRRYPLPKFVIIVPSVAIRKASTKRSRSPKSTSAPFTPTPV